MTNTTNGGDQSYLRHGVLDEDGKLDLQGVMNVTLSFFDRQRCLYERTSDLEIIPYKTYYTRDGETYTPVETPVQSELDSYWEDSTEKEVLLFRTYLDIARKYCARMNQWSFLVKSRRFSEEDIANDNPVPVSEYVKRHGEIRGEVFTEDGVQKCHVYSLYKDLPYAFRLPDDFIKTVYLNGSHRTPYSIKGDLIYCHSMEMTLDYISSDMDTIPSDFGYMIAYRCAIEMASFLDPEGTAQQRASSQMAIALQGLMATESDSQRLPNPPQNHFIDVDSYWGY